ncbi:hypothetical protein NC651_020655 [Populus alba x Populus x berolinensis]|nr:hypothetical protein NC651_020653 [Populus alba x Populus x berolinensis]KAJ6903216.1 hypothetical protein NC651_020655 [Populus alba x Populus x berolinensis]
MRHLQSYILAKLGDRYLIPGQEEEHREGSFFFLEHDR